MGSDVGMVIETFCHESPIARTRNQMVVLVFRSGSAVWTASEPTVVPCMLYQKERQLCV